MENTHTLLADAEALKIALMRKVDGLGQLSLRTLTHTMRAIESRVRLWLLALLSQLPLPSRRSKEIAEPIKTNDPARAREKKPDWLLAHKRAERAAKEQSVKTEDEIPQAFRLGFRMALKTRITAPSAATPRTPCGDRMRASSDVDQELTLLEFVLRLIAITDLIRDPASTLAHLQRRRGRRMRGPETKMVKCAASPVYAPPTDEADRAHAARHAPCHAPKPDI